ncbi:hypothetical protein CDL12_21354 [Handroanthus impetiginosus]|uniref:Uncharacterized protein n=1 Tax=Handroanthus impetiginosus TaxID=429701 RepID=A0A2G9GLH2_9LAMI|nr:hypothetical protein CDL12_21354 [Handroanthus impetiginosus]
MAHQQDHDEIAQVVEGFLYLKNKRPAQEHDVQKPYPKSQENVVQKPYPNPHNRAAPDCNQAAKRYGGIVIMDGRSKDRLRNYAAPEKRTIDCNQAAKKYGGVVIPDSHRTEPAKRHGGLAMTINDRQGKHDAK